MSCPRIAGLALLLTSCVWATDFQSNWPKDLERPWVGPEYWSNPLQDWRLHGGRLECIAAGGDRNVYLLTRDVAAVPGTLSMRVRLGRIEADRAASGPGFAGFRLGIRGIFKNYRDSAVRGYGMNAGLSANGRLFIARQGDSTARLSPPFMDLELRLNAEPAGSAYRVVLRAFDSAGKMLAETRREVPADWLTGGVALVSSSGAVEDTPPPGEKTLDPDFAAKRGTQRGGDVRFWFRDWRVSGTKVLAHEERAWGPILFALHTLSRRVLKLTAQMAPVGAAEPQEVLLQVADSTAAPWRTVAKARIDKMARTATFRVPNWNDTKDTPYRILYGKSSYSGTVRKDPKDKPEIVAAAFTGNNDLGFPHADVVRNVKHFRPDVLIYTGDNIYERVGEYGIQRSPIQTATLDYLRKWYLFGWEYMDLLKEIPAVCLPDDHDVYHGNLWGAGGRHAEGIGFEGQDQGGYTMPAEWVNVVQRTQASHHPDPYDPTPVEQGITVYYSPFLLGGVSFAVVEDRKWKSAPKEFLPKAQIVNGWAQSREYNAARDGDAPGAQLLGPRQEKFLEEWAHDWSGGAWMKAVISQTIFANLATLPAGAQSDSGTPKLKVAQPGEYLEGDVPVADHDSDGWPQTPRTRALRTMRKALAFHIAGDQHLGSTIQYGIDDWNDAGWAICVPSVANIFPRRWFPPQPGRNQKPGAPRYTGEFTEGFGNKVTVHAVSNPHEVAIGHKELNRRAPGYGIVKFRRTTREIEIANWPRWVDATRAGAKPYPGWPITIRQADNGLPRGEWVLDSVQAPGMKDPVIEVIDQSSSELVYAFRIQGSRFTPPVRKDGLYTVKLMDPDRKVEKVFKDLKARPSR